MVQKRDSSSEREVVERGDRTRRGREEEVGRRQRRNMVVREREGRFREVLVDRSRERRRWGFGRRC
jgi:hypothetical protein